jgi:hypothetical protein
MIGFCPDEAKASNMARIEINSFFINEFIGFKVRIDLHLKFATKVMLADEHVKKKVRIGYLMLWICL